MRCRRAPKRNGVHGSCPPGRRPHRAASSRWAERHHPAPAVHAKLDHQQDRRSMQDLRRQEHVEQIDDLQNRARQGRRRRVDVPASACLPDDGSATDRPRQVTRMRWIMCLLHGLAAVASRRVNPP